MKRISLCTFTLLIYMTSVAQKSVNMVSIAPKPGAFTGTYPETKKTDQKDVFFETTVADPYRWLENDMADDTKDWVRRQNPVTGGYLSKIPYRNAIKNRLTELWNYEKYSAPFNEGNYTNYYKNNGLQNQS